MSVEILRIHYSIVEFSADHEDDVNRTHFPLLLSQSVSQSSSGAGAAWTRRARTKPENRNTVEIFVKIRIFRDSPSRRHFLSPQHHQRSAGSCALFVPIRFVSLHNRDILMTFHSFMSSFDRRRGFLLFVPSMDCECLKLPKGFFP